MATVGDTAATREPLPLYHLEWRIQQQNKCLTRITGRTSYSYAEVVPKDESATILNFHHA